MTNKYEEALKYLYENCLVEEFEQDGNSENDTWNYVTPVDQLAVLQELVDKQTPEKAEPVSKEKTFDSMTIRECPVCHGRVYNFLYFLSLFNLFEEDDFNRNQRMKERRYTYCEHCGQRLDWEEENDK